MAERESRRTDAHALARGLVAGTLTAAFITAAGVGCGLAFGPALQRIGYDGVGTWAYLYAIAAGVGFVAFVGSVRANRRYVAPSGTGDDSGGRYADSSALRIARATAGNESATRGLTDIDAVRVWAADLLERDPDGETQ